MKRLLLLGAGHAHVEVLRRVRDEGALPGISITLISETSHAGYSGMMPGVIAGHYSREDAEVDVVRLLGQSKTHFVQASVQEINAAQKIVRTDVGEQSFDVCSLNLGSRPWMPEDVHGMHVPVKPFAEFLDQLSALAKLETLAVVGGGAAAVEVALALARRREKIYRQSAEITLLCAESDILARYPKRVVKRARAKCDQYQIKVITAAKAARAEPNAIILDDGRVIPCHGSVWATGAQPVAALKNTDLARDKGGFVAVDAMQRSVSHASIFAVGDCASRSDRALPKAGVVPVRQGEWLTSALDAALNGGTPKPFHFQRTVLFLLALGDRDAVGRKGPFTFSGEWVWDWKDRIDRKFMLRYK